jgi:hypothetical protein
MEFVVTKLKVDGWLLEGTQWSLEVGKHPSPWQIDWQLVRFLMLSNTGHHYLSESH